MTAVAAGAGAHRARRARWLPQLTGWGFVLPATLVVVGLSVFPAVWALLLSLQDGDLLTGGSYVGLRNYADLLGDAELAAAAGHTLLYTVLFVPGSVALGLLLALALNLRIRLIGFYRTCFFVPYVVSAAATGILANFVFDPDFGIVNAALKTLGLAPMGFLQDPGQAMITLVAISIWGGVGMPAVVYLAALQDIPRELVEAARVDGGAGRHVLRHVVLPQLRPATVFLVIWQTITALQLFDLVYTTTKGQPLDSTTTVVFYLYRQAFQLFHSGYGTAIAYVLFLATLAVSGAVLWRSAR
ncbi:sugar ABC transporter permease [Actinomadura sp. ATCC 31491]|uniref:Sugar ABC transporter permease n=1 Tax=Actinomadura luzonensis TaxID=2805427 RepID=A0ABT0G0K9_9ACTN|nr:sugar ABC transporter permease [Actinomadura luzonensis]MCK2218092.1 sugar ABC transporter permease [Actinomadura luzonensis]